MQRTIEVRELLARLGAVIHEVTHERSSYVVVENGRAEAAIIPYGEPAPEPFANGGEPLTPPEPDDVLAELDAIRGHNDTLGWSDVDSTDIIRWSREGAYKD